MKKLLALLLLSPLAFANVDEKHIQILENIDKFFPNNTYLGIHCFHEKNKNTAKLLSLSPMREAKPFKSLDVLLSF